MGWLTRILMGGLMTAFGYTQIQTWFGQMFLGFGIMSLLYHGALVVGAFYLTFVMRNKDRKEYEKLLKKLRV